MASFNNTDWSPLYHDGDIEGKTRLIGIEFEAQIKELDDLEEDLKFLSEDELDSLEIGLDEYYDDEDIEYDKRVNYIFDELTALGYTIGGVGYDGGGKEFVTHPDSATWFKMGGSERLKKLVKMLERNTIADTASGTHINISKNPKDNKQTGNNLYWMFQVFAPQIEKIFGRRSHWARIPLPQNHFTSIDHHTKIIRTTSKRPNFGEIKEDQTNKSTIIVDKGNRWEFRGAKASHNLEEILAWSEFCLNMVEYCSKRCIKGASFNTLIEGKYISKYASRLTGERAISYNERILAIGTVGYVTINTDNKILKED